jgi:hypothetical protein
MQMAPFLKNPLGPAPFLTPTLRSPGFDGVILRIAAISAVDFHPQCAGGVSEQIFLKDCGTDIFSVDLPIIF